MPKVIIAMPAYRAEATLEKTVTDIPVGAADQLILVDDASPDRTAQLARDLGIVVHVHPENRGYGGNQKTCYTEALREGADIVVMLHPDYQYDPKAVPLLIAPILAGDADMTFGSRFAGLGDPMAGGMPFYRYLGNRLTTTLENLMLGARFTETHSGLRAYSRRCLLSLPFLGYSNDFVFDAQFLVDAVTGGQRVVEVPIPTRYTKESSSISVVRSIKYVMESLSYCARAVKVRGRRGSRWPVATKLSSKPDRRSAEGASDACPICSAARASVDGWEACPSCGLWSAPRVTPWDQGDEGLAGSDESQAMEGILDLLAGFVVRGRRLLQPEAGTGRFLHVAAGRGWDPAGFDPDPDRVKLGESQYKVDLQVGEWSEAQIAPRSVDALVILDALERIADPVGLLRWARFACDEEGILLISMRVALAPDEVVAEPGLQHVFQRSTIQRLMGLASFRLVAWQDASRHVPRAS